MKQKNFYHLWVFMMMILTMLSPQILRASSSVEISNTILLDGSLPVEWQNDEQFPWIVEDGAVKSGNVGNPNTTSSLAFSYTSEFSTEVKFELTTGHLSGNNEVSYYVDGVLKGILDSYGTLIRLFLPSGNHVIEIKDSIENEYSSSCYATINNVKITEIKGLEEVLTEKSLPLSFDNDPTFPWIMTDGIITSSNSTSPGTVSKLQASFSIDTPSKFSFQRRVGYDTSDHYCEFYINNKLYNSSETPYSLTNWDYVSVVLEPGSYTLEWIDYNNYPYAYSECYSQIKEVELNQNWIEVDVTPGTLGVEVLYKVDVLKDLELLKINGQINNDDWVTINQMTNIHAIDFGQAQFDAVPANAFKGLSLLSTVTFPEGVKAIGSNAFQNTNIYSLTIPSSVASIDREVFYGTKLQNITFKPNSQLKSIGYRAFYGCAWLEEFEMPNSVNALETDGDYYVNYGSDTFRDCRSLKKLTFSDSLDSIPKYTCYGASKLEYLHLPANLKSIGKLAFVDNTSLKKVNIPATVVSIGENAFSNSAIDSICLPLRLIDLGSYAFMDCKNLKYVELPSGISNYDYNFYGCNNLKTVVCPSAAPPAIKNDPFYGFDKSNATLVVPSFAVANYKLDSYWYKFGDITEGDDIDYWRISGELSLLNNRRMEGKPDIELTYGGALAVSGNAPMTVKDLDIYVSEENPSRLLNSCNTFSADNLNTHFNVSADRWYFLTPMADVNIRDIKVDNTTSFVFRYYDGDSRAVTGVGSSWKNVTESQLKAGQGYIFQCNANSVVTFPVATDLHEQILSTDAISVPLASHPSDNAANKGWNFVGNPYPCYYDIYYMDFTAPITVWNGSTYRAYSVADDNYVLRPMQGFFVQKPDAVDEIVMQTSGKQISATVNRASYAPTRFQSSAKRALFNIDLTTETNSDMTRVVLNNSSSLEYELECDATKFMSFDGNVSQIYTIDNFDNRLSINERPEVDGKVFLGIYVGDKSKIHTISSSRHDGDIYLYDAEKNITVNLSDEDYSFTPSVIGHIDNRFILSVNIPIVSGINSVNQEETLKVEGFQGAISIKVSGGNDPFLVNIFGIDGRMIHQTTLNSDTSIEVAPGLYVVKIGNISYKIVVN